MMTWPLVLIVLTAFQSQPQETKPVPKDSVEIAATGCLKGRVFTATLPREDVGIKRGPDVTGRSFRVSGPRAVMDDVKKHNGHLVQVVGLVRKGALSDNTPGKRIGNTRVSIGAPGHDTTGTPITTPLANVVVMDLTSVQFLSDSCPIR